MPERLIISSILLLSMPQFACLPQESGQTYLASVPNDCPPKDSSTSVPSKTQAKTKASSGAVKSKESKADQEAVDKLAQDSTKLVGEQKETKGSKADCENPSAKASTGPIAIPNEQLKSKQLQAVEKFGQEAK